MAPSTWATTEQTEYLQSRVEEYCTYKVTRKYDAFWRSLHQDWFEKWPERLALFPDRPHDSDAPLTPAESKLLGTAISKRKDQLQTWYRWITGKSKRTRSALSQSNSFDLLLEKKGSRRLSKTEIYYSEFSDRVHARIEEGNSKSYCDRGVRLNIAKSCAKKLLACEDEATKTLIDGLYNNQKATKDGSDAQKTDPESIQRSIDNLPYVLDAFAKIVKNRTGYTTSFVCAGPDPSRNWAITSLSYHPDEIEGVGTFSSQHPEEEHKYLQAYQDFAEVLLSEDVRNLTVKGDDGKHGEPATGSEELPDGASGNKNSHDSDEEPAHADGPELSKSAEKRGGNGLVGHDGLYMLSPLPSHASDASTSPPPPIYQTDASVSGSGSSQAVATAKPLTVDSAILPPADASLRPLVAGHFSSDFDSLSNTFTDLDTYYYRDMAPYSAGSAATYGVPETFTGGPVGISFSQAMDEATQDFNTFNWQVSSGSNSDGEPPVFYPQAGEFQWTFTDPGPNLVTNPPGSMGLSVCAQTNTAAPSPLATVPLPITLTNAATVLPVASTDHQVPGVSTVDAQSLKQQKSKVSPPKKNLPTPGESTPTLQSSPPSPQADATVKRVRKKSTRNELANAIGTNMPSFFGKENIPPEAGDSEGSVKAGRKRKQMAMNGSPNKRAKKL